MTQPPPLNLPTLNLQYMSPVRPQYQQRAEKVLLVWIIINLCLTPLSLFFGLMSLFMVVMLLMRTSGWSGPLWGHLTPLQIMGVILYLFINLVQVVVPPTWLVLCWLCRKRLQIGDLRGATLGIRLCWLAMGSAGLYALGVLYMLVDIKSDSTARGPFWFCIGLLVAILVFLVAVVYTRRVLRAVLRN